MVTRKAGAAAGSAAQEVCIDLPGESVQCWRSSDKVKVILRKHRDVIFDINLKSDTTYTLESESEFYSPREKKLLKRANFFDGERFQIWVGREFKGCLVLTVNGAILGKYKVVELDPTNYGSDPKTKPEPLLVVLGKQAQSSPFAYTPADPLNACQSQLDIFATLNPKLPLLSSFSSTRFDYTYSSEPPEVKEYVVVAEVKAEEIRPDVLNKLEAGAVSGTPSELFLSPPKAQPDSHLYKALGAVASVVAGSEVMTSNPFKETAGYLQENFRALDKLLMTIRIEKRKKGMYRAVLKGKPISRVIAASLAGKTAKVAHQNVALGSKASSFIDGGYVKTGAKGYGGAKRIMLTAADKFKGGMKIQVIGTVIDLFVNAHTVYFDEKGSKDFSEFLGRAGVSIAKAGMTAAMGSVFAAVGVTAVTALTALVGLGAAPVIAVMAVVIGGYILAATIVDGIDNGFGIKQTVAELSR